MKIFLSYASEDRASAELVMESLAARGHDVFFDRDQNNLPPGATFEDRIERAIAQADAFVFLISGHSIASGSFTLTELTIARKKWSRADARVLPVMLTETDLTLVPAYLRSVTILEPVGNLPAEVAMAVDAMRRWRPTSLTRSAVAAILVIVATMAYVFWPTPDLVVNVAAPVRWERGFFDAPNRYKLTFDLLNMGRRAGRIISAEVQTEPSAAVETVSHGVAFSAESPTVIASGGMITNHFIVTLTGAVAAPFLWSICATSDTGVTSCSEHREWIPQGSFVPKDAFRVDPEVSAKAVLLAAAPDGFFVATRNPGSILNVGMDGSVKRQVYLGGEPTALLAQEGDLLVGARGPDSVMRLDPDSFDIKERFYIRFPSQVLGALSTPISSTPVSIAKSDGRVWIVTRGGASTPGLIHLSDTLSDPVVPPWFEEIASDLDGLHLTSGGNVVWGAVTNVTPASLYRLSRDKLTVFSGHDWDIAECTTDLLTMGDTILVPDCTGTIQAVNVAENYLTIAERIGSASGYDSSTSIWTELRLRQDTDGRVAAFTVNWNRDNAMALSRTVVTRLDPKEGPSLALEVRGSRVVDMAMHKPIFMVILEDGHGSRETLALAGAAERQDK